MATKPEPKPTHEQVRKGEAPREKGASTDERHMDSYPGTKSTDKHRIPAPGPDADRLKRGKG